MSADPRATSLPDALRTVWRDERAGATLPSGTADAGRRLHRCQRGNVSLLVLFMGLVFYALAALAWNTGEITSAKIETQTAADSAAYSSAVWTSRAVNIVVATNMLALRDASAMGVAVAALFEGAWVFGWQTYFFVQNIVPLLSGLPFTLPALLPLLAVYLQDLGQWIHFVIITRWPVYPIKDIVELGIHLSELLRYQQEWVDVLPAVIAEQEAQLEAYYDCDLELVMGNGQSDITAPLHRGTQLTCLIPMTARFAYDALPKGSWYADPILKAIVIGKGKKGWLIGSLLGYLSGWTTLGQTHHVLSSQPRYSPLEFGTYGTGIKPGPHTWEDFTVVARAQKRLENRDSLQAPRYPLGFMAPGIFGDADPLRPVAYAQAETFNGIDGLVSTANIAGFNVLQPFLSLYPWRVWTDWGWQWQPRLTYGDLVEPGVFDGTGLALPPFAPNFRETVTNH